MTIEARASSAARRPRGRCRCFAPRARRDGPSRRPAAPSGLNFAQAPAFWLKRRDALRFARNSVQEDASTDPWPCEAKILYLWRSGEEIIFSLRAFDDTYIENNSSQLGSSGIEDRNAVSADIPRSEAWRGAARRLRRCRARQAAFARFCRRARALVCDQWRS